MRESLMHAGGLALLGASLLPATALALPWDVDMVDSPAVRGYECWMYETDDEGNKTCVNSMRDLPEGIVAQAHILTPNDVMTPMLDKFDPAWAQVDSPLSSTPEVLATGKTMFVTYCGPCHGIPDEQGVIAQLGTVAQPGRFAGVVALTGDNGVLQARTDGQVYRAIRMGNALMPSYNWAMTDAEMWSIVHYSRTLDNGAYVPPEPEPVEEAEE